MKTLIELFDSIEKISFQNMSDRQNAFFIFLFGYLLLQSAQKLSFLIVLKKQRMSIVKRNHEVLRVCAKAFPFIVGSCVLLIVVIGKVVYDFKTLF